MKNHGKVKSVSTRCNKSLTFSIEENVVIADEKDYKILYCMVCLGFVGVYVYNL
jgi:hypothetical protein